MKPSLTKHGTKAVTMAEEPSMWIFPRSGSLFLTMTSLQRVITLAAATHYGFTVDDLKERKGLKEFFGFKEKEDQMTIDTTNMCSHLQKKLFEEDGIYHPLWLAMQDDPELTAVVRSRQLHIYRNGKKVLVLAGKAAPKVIREDKLCEMLQQ